jgi:hypothetical protein
MPLQRAAPLAQVDPDRPGDAARADAEMAIEPLVLRRHDRVDQMRAGRVGVDHAAELVAAPGEDVAVPVEHGDRPARPGVERLGHIGKLDVVVARRDREDQRHGNPAAPGQAPEKTQDEPKAAAIQPSGRDGRLRADGACAVRAGCGRLARRPRRLWFCRTRRAGLPPTCACPGGAVCAPDLNHSSQSPFSGAFTGLPRFAAR